MAVITCPLFDFQAPRIPKISHSWQSWTPGAARSPRYVWRQNHDTLGAAGLMSTFIKCLQVWYALQGFCNLSRLLVVQPKAVWGSKIFAHTVGSA